MNSLLPLGDQAVLAYFPDESAASRFAAAVRGAAAPWVVDVVQAYTSVAVFFDLDQVRFLQVAEYLAEIEQKQSTSAKVLPGQLHTIPCCYELQLDLDRIAQASGLAPDEVIRLHAATEYTVYAIGFCPGFPYL